MPFPPQFVLENTKHEMKEREEDETRYEGRALVHMGVLLLCLAAAAAAASSYPSLTPSIFASGSFLSTLLSSFVVSLRAAPLPSSNSPSLAFSITTAPPPLQCMLYFSSMEKVCTHNSLLPPSFPPFLPPLLDLHHQVSTRNVVAGAHQQRLDLARRRRGQHLCEYG